VQIQVERQVENRRITADHLDRWFPKAETGERPSYAQHLREAGLKPTEYEQVVQLYQRQLLNQTVAWHSTFALVMAKR
jgi:hypothetical protein